MTEVHLRQQAYEVGQLRLGGFCPNCGDFVGRVRGNLRRHESWRRAANALLRKHIINCERSKRR